MKTDDPAIPDTEVLFRRIARSGDTNMIVTDEASGDRKVRSGAFDLSEDGCSVFRASVLLRDGLGPSDVVVDPQNVVIAVTAELVRSVELGIRPDPWPHEGGNHQRNAAHALILNVGGLGSKRLHKARQHLAANVVFVLS